MAQATATAADIFTQIMDPANRANPYPLYAQLREVPITPLADGFYAIAHYQDIEELLQASRKVKAEESAQNEEQDFSGDEKI